jgi:hypothetical protein
MDLLLYDAVVFPTPSDEVEATRWDGNGWDTGLLARRVTQLGDLAYTAPWGRKLRDLWREIFDLRARENPNEPTLAFDLSAQLLANQFFAELVGQDDDRLKQLPEPPELLPAFANRDVRKYSGRALAELVAAHQDIDQARRVYGITTERDRQPFVPPPDSGLCVQLDLAAPEVVEDESMLFKVLKLVEDEDFRIARRRLWHWEEERADYTPQEAAFAVRQLVADYNEEVMRHLGRTRLRRVLYVVPLTLGVGVKLMMPGAAGVVAAAGVGVAVDLVKAKFPQLGEKGERLSHHPGSAVRGAMSVLAHN